MNSLASLFIFFGSLIFFFAALGVIRLPDTLSRMHAASKGSSLGLGCILFGYALASGSLSTALKSLIIIVGVLLTVPVATHLLARAVVQRENPAICQSDGNKE